MNTKELFYLLEELSEIACEVKNNKPIYKAMKLLKDAYGQNREQTTNAK